MVEYDKVIRIALDSELFYEEISTDVAELWANYEDLKEQPGAYKFLLTCYPKELEALKNKEIDFIVLSNDYNE